MGTGYLHCSPLPTVCGWVSLAWKLLPQEIVHKYFCKCRISNVPGGTENDSLWDVGSETHLSSGCSSDDSDASE